MSAPVVIFDLDGTLVDSVPVCVEIVDGMLAERGGAGRACAVTARSLASVGGATMIAAMLGEHCGDPDAEIAEFRRRYASHPTPPDSLFEGVRSGLQRLSDGDARLAICSNKPQQLCEKVLKDLGLIELFEVIVGGAPGRRPKPAPDLLTAVLAALGCVAEDCVFVGDSDLDHSVADAADMPFLFVEYGYAPIDWDVPGLARHARFDDLIAALSRPLPVRMSARA